MTAPHPLAELAATARAATNAAPDGTAERKAAGCVAVALSTTRTLAAARKALATVRPPTVKADALAYLDMLTAPQEPAARPDAPRPTREPTGTSSAPLNPSALGVVSVEPAPARGQEDHR